MNTPRLLIVDDEERILSALQRVLRREGYEILTAGSGAEGIVRLRAAPVDLVLCDHKMPRSSGLVFLEQAAKLCPQAARLLITGWPDEVSDAETRRLGLRAVIPKPWDDAELKATLRNALE